MKQLSYILFFCASLSLYGQQASIELDSSFIRIGEQTVLHVYFEYQNPKGDALIIWPEYDDALTKDIDIVDKTIDRDFLLDSASTTYLREQRLLITAFEEGKYTIPSQEIRLGDSLYYTNKAQLMVETVQVDTSKGIADIKPIYSVNYPFSERSKDWLNANWYWLTIIAALILAFFIYRYVKRRKPEVEEEVLEEIIPAHVIALDALQKLLAGEEWKSPEKKVYYSDLTDTVRTYLENRFDIHAMEQTTREIITDLKHASISEVDKVYLRKILREADMVKFAKFTPSDEDAYAYIHKSIDFVKRTKEKKNSGN
ncbi:MAG: hypothetical protein P8I55_01105 [Crocinitomix sp.]|nr:hypothetical protein [Crocinitomix sp.]